MLLTDYGILREGCPAATPERTPVKIGVLNNAFCFLVGATGFEPVTPCAQGRCATRLRYAPTSVDYSGGAQSAGALNASSREVLIAQRGARIYASGAVSRQPQACHSGAKNILVSRYAGMVFGWNSDRRPKAVTYGHFNSMFGIEHRNADRPMNFGCSSPHQANSRSPLGAE